MCYSKLFKKVEYAQLHEKKGKPIRHFTPLRAPYANSDAVQSWQFVLSSVL